MTLDVEEFDVNLHYFKEEDSLELNTDRQLKNSDLLLILIHMLNLVDEEHRNDLVDIAFAVLEQRKHTNIN
jgi:hypothetical protein